MNIKIKWFIHENYFSIVFIIFLALIILAVMLYVNGSDWKILITVIGGFISFAYFIQKQQLDEAKFANELFVQFNRRYADLNKGLTDIIENKSSLKELPKELSSGERDTLNNY